MRRIISNTTAPALGNTEQVQPQATASGALRTTFADCDVATVTLTLDTSAYASGDLLADTQLVSLTAFDQKGGCIMLDTIHVLDEDAQGVATYAIFIQDSTSLGTENSAPNISDANARKIVGMVSLASANYVTVSGAKIATYSGLGLIMKAAAGSQALYVALLNAAGTPTFTATGVQLMLGWRQV